MGPNNGYNIDSYLYGLAY